MDGINTSMDSLEISLKRLASAVEALEWATDLRMRHDEARATTQEEFALMQDDRSRLAVELDAAVDRSRALESANSEAAKRLAHAAQAIERVLGRFGAGLGRLRPVRRGKGARHVTGFGHHRRAQVSPRLQRGRRSAA